MGMASPKLSYKGCGISAAAFVFVKVLRSCNTAALMVIKLSTAPIKYFVKGLSPGLFSCGITLSAMHTTLEYLFFFAIRSMVPRHGPIKGNQYRTTSKSAFSFFSMRPTLIQLSGLTELMATLIFKSAGAASLLYCVVPGKRKEGYCREKV